MTKVLKNRYWNSVNWQLVRTGAKAGKYRYTVRVRPIFNKGPKAGKFGAWTIKKTTKSLSEARKLYSKWSYNRRTRSQAGV